MSIENLSGNSEEIGSQGSKKSIGDMPSFEEHMAQMKHNKEQEDFFREGSKGSTFILRI